MNVMSENEIDIELLRAELDTMRTLHDLEYGENVRLREAMIAARAALGPGDDERSDSPGNMAFAILSAALDGGARFGG